MKRFGIEGLQRLVEVERPNGRVILLPRVDVYTEIPTGQDIDEGKFQQVVNTSLDEALAERVISVEDFLSKVAHILKGSLPDGKIEVSLEAEYVVYRETPMSQQGTQEMYKILSRASSDNGKIRKMIGAEVTGITACPCAQEGVTELVREDLGKEFSPEDVDRIMKKVVIASHNQRNVSELMIEVPEECSIEVEELITILEVSLSSRLFEVLKRDDEVKVVLDSHRAPFFVEDVVRRVLVNVSQTYDSLPDDSLVYVKSESYETIHQHNAVAERTVTLGNLKSEMGDLKGDFPVL